MLHFSDAPQAAFTTKEKKICSLQYGGNDTIKSVREKNPLRLACKFQKAGILYGSAGSTGECFL